MTSPEPRAGQALWLDVTLIQPIVAEAAARVARDATDRDDLIQEVNLSLLSRPVHTEALKNVRAYVIRMVRNRHLNDAAARARRGREVAYDTDLLPASDRDPRTETTEGIDRVLAALGPREAQVLQAWLCDPVIKSVARALYLDVRQVKRSLARCAHTVMQFIRCCDSCPPALSLDGEVVVRQPSARQCHPGDGKEGTACQAELP